jgi:hypothetical protein
MIYLVTHPCPPLTHPCPNILADGTSHGTHDLSYPTSCYGYDNQDLSHTHRHTATDDHFQHGLPGVCGVSAVARLLSAQFVVEVVQGMVI